MKQNWQVICIHTNTLRPDSVFESELAYNEARTMAKDYNEANHHGQIFKAVKASPPTN